MFQAKPYHDWTSHGADEYRYAAVVEVQMGNAPASAAYDWLGAALLSGHGCLVQHLKR
jgi:hypothetical protein